ncbi:choice-of-anchor Q domain-containing protein [Conexibacter stalactiti]|uniref:Choice-of-anchor Q domain-containing protein n=1 Tax=Conexibacter stalactiti TaxID=1940611 RepID=A0ABU4HVW1_9ACTN|nr:choice-of-anchor Q domain-containing protein [Conexibacter stalactiti]MDW5597358.1 choice-of-anchor Q domain-containing protein [Conexibacter stalactiti]MEC5038000.1 choice-of-anchor Q domain-containing protein [Conexibacter stalactiti]
MGRGRLHAAATTIGALAALAIGAPGTATAAVPSFSVTTTADPIGDGACEVGGTCSLRQALVASGAGGGTIALPAGIYQLQRGALTVNASIANPITVTGAGAGAGGTTIEQTGSDRVLNVLAGLVEVSGVTLTGGDLRGDDGPDGEAAEDSAPAFDGTPGEAVSGAGVRNSGRLTLTDVVVTGNRAEGGDGGDGGDDGGMPIGAPGRGGAGGSARGGAIDNQERLTLVRTVVSGNVAQAGSGGASGSGTSVDGGGGGVGGIGSGGGIENAGRLSLVDATVRDNVATAGDGGGSPWTTPGFGGRAGGGGIASDGPSLTIERSTISGNLARSGSSFGVLVASGGRAEGGGLRVAQAFTLRDATVAGNRVLGGAGSQPAATPPVVEGGGIWAGDGATLEQVTVAGNTASTSEAAPATGRGGNLHATTGSVQARGVLIAGGVGADGSANCSAALDARGGSVEQAGAAGCGLELTVADVQLAALAANGGPTETRALAPASPAIGAGSCARLDGAPVAQDQRGLPRPATGCDAGAYEQVTLPNGGDDPIIDRPGPGRPRTDPPRAERPDTGKPGTPPGSSSQPRAPRLTAVAVVRRGERSTLRFTLDRAARVTLVYRAATTGRRRGRTIGTVALHGRKGVNRVRLSDRVGRRALAPGRYRLTLTAVSAGRAGRARTAVLTVARRHSAEPKPTVSR